MATYPRVRLKVSEFVTPTKLQKKLLEIIGNDRVKRGVNQIIGDRANKYVPEESGALRASMRIGPKTITWGEGLDYARYQYGGEIYGQNYPIWLKREHVQFGNKKESEPMGLPGSPAQIIGWWSLPDTEKVPTGRELGLPGHWHGWRFGYSTPGTKHHWVDEMLKHERRAMQNQITQYLKSEANKK